MGELICPDGVDGAAETPDAPTKEDDVVETDGAVALGRDALAEPVGPQPAKATALQTPMMANIKGFMTISPRLDGSSIEETG